MSRKPLLLAGALFCALSLSAQETWREGRNTGGLTLYEQGEAQVLLGGTFTSGGFRTPSEASQLWGGGVQARAETHYKDLVLTGQFSFDVKSGQEMMGSMFTNPGYYPIDVLEFTPGPKTRQTYGISGGMAWNTRSRWAPGITLRFEGVNYSKRKDLRHTTYRQEVDIVPSLLYRGDVWRVGASAILGKTSEFVQAEQIGTATAQTYYAFLDKGRRFGTYQAWDGSGIHLAEPGVDRLAVNQYSLGAALQLSRGERFYGDLEYRFSPGSVGEKGYTWFRFRDHDILGKVLWNIDGKDGTHTLRLDGCWNTMVNNESVIDKVTEGGVTTPREYGSNRIYVRYQETGGLSYAYESRKGWNASAAFRLNKNRELGTLMYPFLEFDEGLQMEVELQGGLPLGRFNLEGGLLFRKELAENHYEVDSDETEEGVTSRPFRLREWWDQEEEYNDVPLLGGFLNIRYPFTLARKYKLFAQLGCSVSYAFNVELLPGNKRQTTHITLGYCF